MTDNSLATYIAEACDLHTSESMRDRKFVVSSMCLACAGVGRLTIMTARMLNAMSNDTVQTLYQRLVVVFVIPQLHTLPRAACDAAVRRLDI